MGNHSFRAIDEKDRNTALRVPPCLWGTYKWMWDEISNQFRTNCWPKMARAKLRSGQVQVHNRPGSNQPGTVAGALSVCDCGTIQLVGGFSPDDSGFVHA